MLKEIVEAIRNKVQTKPTKNHTLIDTRKMSPAKKSKMMKETTSPESKGRKPRKTKRG